MNEIVGIKVIVISNIYNFACENMVLKPTVVELEQGGPLGGLAHWAVNPSNQSRIRDHLLRLLVVFSTALRQS